MTKLDHEQTDWINRLSLTPAGSRSRVPGAKQQSAGPPILREAPDLLLTYEASPRYQLKKGHPFAEAPVFLIGNEQNLNLRGQSAPASNKNKNCSARRVDSVAGAPMRRIGKGAKTNFAAKQRRRNHAPAARIWLIICSQAESLVLLRLFSFGDRCTRTTSSLSAQRQVAAGYKVES